MRQVTEAMRNAAIQWMSTALGSDEGRRAHRHLVLTIQPLNMYHRPNANTEVRLCAPNGRYMSKKNAIKAWSDYVLGQLDIPVHPTRVRSVQPERPSAPSLASSTIPKFKLLLVDEKGNVKTVMENITRIDTVDGEVLLSPPDDGTTTEDLVNDIVLTMDQMRGAL